MSNGKNPLMLMMAMTVPGAAHALGLGDMHVTSNLNERLSADIDIVGATSIELNGLRATLANRDVFTRYGFDHPSFLSSMTFKVGADAQGHPVLSLRSTESFNEPVVNFLVDVHWGSGELVREYTLLLDPAELGTAIRPSAWSRAQTDAPTARETANTAAEIPAVAAAAAPPSEGIDAEGSGVENGTTTSVSPLPSEAEVTTVADARTMTHVKVGARATLRGIAWRIGERSESDLQRMMIAIFRDNPSAFDGNINLLHLGAVLTIPSAGQIESISRAEAKQEVHAQMTAWRAAAPARAARLAARTATPAASPAASEPAASVTTAAIPAASVPAAAPAGSGADAGPDAESNQALNHRIQSLEQELRDMKGTLDQERDQLAAMQAYAVRLEQTRAATAAHPVTLTAPAPAQSSAAPQVQVSHSSALPMLGGLGLLGAALAGIYLKLRRRSAAAPDSSPDQETVRGGAAAEAVPTPVRQIAPAPSYEVVETMPLRALSAQSSLDATTKLEELGFDNVSLEDSHRVQSILEGSGDDPTHRLPAVADRTHRLPSLAEATQRLSVVDRTEQTVRLQASDNMRSEQSRSDLHVSDLDLTSQTHVQMPSALNENTAFKERRSNLADVLRKSLEREPDRDDLRMKLLELYYSNAATNQQGFLEMVEKFANERGSMQGELWDRIAAMGRQIAGENPLFSAEPAADEAKGKNAAAGGNVVKIA